MAHDSLLRDVIHDVNEAHIFHVKILRADSNRNASNRIVSHDMITVSARQKGLKLVHLLTYSLD